MEKKQAMEFIQQMYSGFKGTIQEHHVLQEALKTINNELFPIEKIKKDKK